MQKRKGSLGIVNLGEQYLFWMHFWWLVAFHYLVHWSGLVKITISSVFMLPSGQKGTFKDTNTLCGLSFFYSFGKPRLTTNFRNGI